MTLGTKLRAARTAVGLSQDELATKLCVSRQAVTKWENDKGIPDIANLKAAAELFGVSIDYLVTDADAVAQVATREPIGDLRSYTKHGKARSKQDAVVQTFYPKAVSIRPLVRRTHLTWWLRIIDFATQNGTVAFVDGLRDPRAWYLVDLGSRQLLVSVGREVIESRELTAPMTDGKIHIGSDTYSNGFYSF